ncbi:biotin--[acetyl-CoA-carboxylase] ligase [Phytoactinopolyspora halophila]|uniref:biotin--[acetyl-CoA-carboxylase] ligase n=1 Tax=Phytoactinopolyspora halophila TaxID=1981511 RepID=UPI001B8BAC6B|nr:biotin--[acetyl-CoA-carboxylase] ligase [Phytoactinopolyspora halophila]
MWDVRRVAETGSTNVDVADLARDGAPEGIVLAAEYQRAGRGRLDRTWQAPPGTSLAVSFLLRPTDVAPERWAWLPLLVGVAVVDAVEQLTDIRAVLKWPNDVLVGERKLAGILVEQVQEEAGAAAVAGVGLNVAQRAEQLPPTGTSLLVAAGGADESGSAGESGDAGADRRAGADDGAGADGDVPEPPSFDDVLEVLIDRFAARYEAWRSHGGDPESELAQLYRRRCATLGRWVRVQFPDHRFAEGEAVDLDSSGRLVIRGSGGLWTVGAGDIVHLRPAPGTA